MKGVKFRLGDNSKFSIRDSNKDLRDIFSSGTVFSALINNIDLLYGNEEASKTVELFKDQEFSISSMYMGLDFYNRDKDIYEKTLYFVPKPEALIEKKVQGNEKLLEENVIKRKKAKKIKMISIQALEEISKQWINGESRFDYDLFSLTNIGSNLACLREEVDFIDIKELEGISFDHELSNPHVQVNRDTNLSENFFYEDEKTYRYQYVKSYRIEPFMYFMYSGDLSDELKSAINLIVDEGIGGKRSTGMGTFLSNEFVDIELDSNESSDLFITLSSYFPLKEEMDKLLGYKLEKIDGYIYYKGGQPYRKKSIGMIKEGAITKERVKGQLVDVTPQSISFPNRIYSNGIAFSIGVGGDKIE